MNPECDSGYKVALIGNPGVGKSSLILRFAGDTFTESYISTNGCKKHIIEQDRMAIKVEIWDTAGQSRETAINALRGAHGVIVVYDVTEFESVKSVLNWLRDIRRYTEGSYTLLVANKCDLVTKEVVDTLKNAYAENSIPFLDTSAKSATNVEEAFSIMAAEIKKRMIPSAATSSVPSVVSAPGGTAVGALARIESRLSILEDKLDLVISQMYQEIQNLRFDNIIMQIQIMQIGNANWSGSNENPRRNG